MTFLGRCMKRGHVVEILGVVNGSPFSNKTFHYVEVSGIGGGVQRSQTAFVATLNICTPGKN
ncbi:hypothetical protein D3C87_2065500 [compost metagenome]